MIKFRLVMFSLALAAAGCAGSALGQSFSVVPRPEFAIISQGQPVSVALQVVNHLDVPVTLSAVTLSNSAFSLVTALPVQISAYGTTELQVTATPVATALDDAVCQITGLANGSPFIHSSQITVGLFLDDGGEVAFTARRALDAYNQALAADSGLVAKNAAVANDRGVLYRLLRAYSQAADQFDQAINSAVLSSVSVAGIDMNYGVLASDQNSSMYASLYYSNALAELYYYAPRRTSKLLPNSVLAAQLFYNQGWEAFAQNDLNNSVALVRKVTAHKQASKMLKAKAYLLWAGVYLQQGKRTMATAAAKKAISLDPTGPIGALATADLLALTPGQIQFRQSSYSVSENVGWMDIPVSRIGGDGGDVSITCTTYSGSAKAGVDYVSQTNVFSWGDGDSAERVFRLQIVGDAVPDKSKSLRVRLSKVTGGAKLGKYTFAAVNILDP